MSWCCLFCSRCGEDIEAQHCIGLVMAAVFFLSLDAAQKQSVQYFLANYTAMVADNPSPVSQAKTDAGGTNGEVQQGLDQL